jgi:fibro-slime domain-containing protein
MNSLLRGLVLAGALAFIHGCGSGGAAELITGGPSGSGGTGQGGGQAGNGGASGADGTGGSTYLPPADSGLAGPDGEIIPTCTGDQCAPPPDAGPVCGNGVLESGEQCDDDNTTPGDGCSPVCVLMPGWECKVVGQPCTQIPSVCGDGLLVGFPQEVCDEGPGNKTPGCSADCMAIAPNYNCDVPGQPCVKTTDPVVCGDGHIGAGETCDDGNYVSGDGCTGTDQDAGPPCQREPGYTCPTPGARCTKDEWCGDGKRDSAGVEECDLGANNGPLFGCSGICKVLPFWTCTWASDGTAACVSQIVCGDGKVVGDERCDDGNTKDGDGCSSTCQVEPGWTCPKPPTAGACTKDIVPACGDGILSYGEFCDEGPGNKTAGCSADCKTITPGWDCSIAGQSCTRQAYCGDGTPNFTIGEQCDDGNTTNGDGCNSTCKVEANWICPNGKNCVHLVCGDGTVNGAEQCDDSNTTNGDGCSSTCQVEPGWTCPVGAKCRPARCGDGIKVGNEQCDDGNTTNGDGCSSACKLESGWKCAGSPSTCSHTTCGDGIKEGTEECDDGNKTLGDGCTPFCTIEPKCTDASGTRTACSSVCGDGIKFPSEACDDGNNASGDGCSSTCTVEAGWTCSVPVALPAQITLPVVYHDFEPGLPQTANTGYLPAGGHPDFWWDWGYWNNGGGTYNVTPAGDPNHVTVNIFPAAGGSGMVRTLLGTNADLASGNILLTGKPIFAYVGKTVGAGCPLAAGQLRRNGVDYCAITTLNGDSFNQWYRDTALSSTVVQSLTLNKTGSNTYVFDSAVNLPDGSTPGTPPDGFFPLDGQAGAKTYASCSNVQHNFLFTSEVHYWFQYNPASNATLTFRGDDDVYVFINGHLVVDIGGVHSALPGSVVVNASTRDTANNLLNLASGSVYEVIVFQAERNPCASNYRLELDNFLLNASTCNTTCGDGIVAGSEMCDEGANNKNGYGTCQMDCTLGPRCGDATVQAANGEQCDNGLNLATYSNPKACGPGCKWSAYCGDSIVQGANGEQCDDGVNTSTYGGCAAGCVLAPFCGDGKITNGEECDDGASKNGTASSTCGRDCKLKCGNGTLDPGEQCDLGKAQNTGAYGTCNSDCTYAPRCGDGIVQAGEQCDDGKNDGTYGTCAPGCVLAPRCGDSVVQTGEECDLGAANDKSAYGVGTCTDRCKVGPYCGDKQVDIGHELCDDGKNDGTPGSCKPDCSAWIPIISCGDGVLQTDKGEQCDHGANNGKAGDTCDAQCRFTCGNGRIDPGEQCDDGVNDGTYGTCTSTCQFAGYCGDGTKNGPEQCDLGAANDNSAYGLNKCTKSCQKAPYCGDGRIDVTHGEECDNVPGCDTVTCKWNIIPPK